MINACTACCALSFCAESLCGPDLDACPVSEIKYVTCEIPPGTGAGNPVTVYREGRAPYYANGTQRLTVDYHAPSIESITPALIETTGGEVVLRGPLVDGARYLGGEAGGFDGGGGARALVRKRYNNPANIRHDNRKKSTARRQPS